eukprot:1145507-Alexandrium_andersonii.AAC.1
MPPDEPIAHQASLYETLAEVVLREKLDEAVEGHEPRIEVLHGVRQPLSRTVADVKPAYDLQGVLEEAVDGLRRSSRLRVGSSVFVKRQIFVALCRHCGAEPRAEPV